MNRRRQRIQYVLRNMHLLAWVDHFRWCLALIRCFRRNRRFRKQHPDFCTPPPFLAYDAYASVNWSLYHDTGLDVAKAVANYFRQYNSQETIAILEWGCGPARVIRHMRDMFPTARICGTDYNKSTIRWCQAHIPKVEFRLNALTPPLDYPSETFDFIYVLSVFTHLSESVGLSWMQELIRVLKPGGILFFTTHSDTSADLLFEHEKRIYKGEGVYVRGAVAEGKKMFTAFHSPAYVRNALLSNCELLKYVPQAEWFRNGTQEAWIARKL
jgi:SAM-dependent methyltransferase